jgi:hypothetical protein
MQNRWWWLATTVVLLAACGGQVGAAASAAVAPPRVITVPPAVVQASRQVAVAPPPALAEGEDFIAEARLIYRVVACGDDSATTLDAATIERHCTRLRKEMAAYRRRYRDIATPFINGLKPPGIPTVVVYPFGGGDLLSALTAFPEATEITTISLEFAGDPRRVATLTSPKKLGESLEVLETITAHQLAGAWNWSQHLKMTQKGELPGQLVFALVALAVHGYEPTSLRYFKLRPDGSIDYLDAQEIKDVEGKNPHRLRPVWVSPDWSEAFSNMELRMRPRGGGPEKVFRHIAFNLDDRHLRGDPSLLAHLEAKGQVSAMTRAASYLLWEPSFSRVARYLADHLVWMVSDSTGLPPPVARAAGLTQLTYGKFEGAFQPPDQTVRTRYDTDFIRLWKRNPHVKLPFLFGYFDVKRHSHMLVTMRPQAP